MYARKIAQKLIYASGSSSEEKSNHTKATHTSGM